MFENGKRKIRKFTGPSGKNGKISDAYNQKQRKTNDEIERELKQEAKRENEERRRREIREREREMWEEKFNA